MIFRIYNSIDLHTGNANWNNTHSNTDYKWKITGLKYSLHSEIEIRGKKIEISFTCFHFYFSKQINTFQRGEPRWKYFWYMWMFHLHDKKYLIFCQKSTCCFLVLILSNNPISCVLFMDSMSSWDLDKLIPVIDCSTTAMKELKICLRTDPKF